MQGLRGLAWLLALQSAGELLARGLHLPFPGPVVGLVLLLPALNWAPVRDPVSAAANLLLANLSLLFVGALNLALRKHLPDDVRALLQDKQLRISVSDAGIAIDNGQGARIVLHGPAVTINGGALEII